VSGIGFLSQIHKNLCRFTGEKARPTGASECGPDQKSYLISGMGILPMLNNGAISQLELRYCTILNKLCMNRQDACSTRKFPLCATGILPVPENGARYQLKLRCCTILNKLCMNRQDACSTRKFTLCGTGILPVPENGARYQLEGIFCRIFLENGLSGDRLNC